MTLSWQSTPIVSSYLITVLSGPGIAGPSTVAQAGCCSVALPIPTNIAPGTYAIRVSGGGMVSAPISLEVLPAAPFTLGVSVASAGAGDPVTFSWTDLGLGTGVQCPALRRAGRNDVVRPRGARRMLQHQRHRAPRRVGSVRPVRAGQQHAAEQPGEAADRSVVSGRSVDERDVTGGAMRESWIGVLIVVGMTVAAERAAAQPLGSFTWQLQPFCNRVTVNVRQDGSSTRWTEPMTSAAPLRRRRWWAWRR